MLMHPPLDRLRAYEADDLSGEQRRRTAEHLARCPRCRSTLTWMDGMRTVARMPVPEPSADAWRRIAERVAAGEPVLLPVDRPDAAPRRRSALLGGQGSRALRVAGLALLLAGAAAAAVLPGSPVRSWIESILPAADGAPEPGAVPPAVPVDVPPVALLVEPSAGRVVVSLERPDSAVRIHVRLVEGEELEVQALHGAAAATFRTSAGRLDIVAAEAGAIILGVPRGLRSARIVVDGRALLIKENGEVRILAPTADTVGAEYILPVRGTDRPAGSR